MNNIKIAIKRFFQNKNTVTILAVILCLVILYLGYDYRIRKATEPMYIPYALKEIEPRTQITSDMIGVIKTPGSRITNNVITSKSAIVGKYVAHDATVPAGSLFYKDILVNWEDIPSSLWQDIPNGYTVVSLPVNLDKTYGNSIFPGNYIDLYYVKTTKSQETSGLYIFGKFIESIKVLGVIDSKGNDVFEKTSNLSAPSSLVFAVPEDLHLLLRKALYLARMGGDIIPVPRNAEYSSNPGATRVSSTYIQNYILGQTVTVDDNDLGNLEYVTGVENGGENR